MKAALVIFLATMGALHANLNKWLSEVDENYSRENMVRSASVQREYGYLKEKYPIDFTTIATDEFKKELEAAGRRKIKGVDRESDTYLGYAYCESVGIKAELLLDRTRCNEMFLTWLVVELVTNLKVWPTGFPEKVSKE